MKRRGLAVLGAAACLLLFAAPGADAAKTRVKATSVSVAEGSAEAVLKVRVSPRPKRAVKVRFETIGGTAASPADYTAREGLLRFRKGQKSRELAVALVDDALDEADETFRVRLKAAGKKAARPIEPTVTITDDDAPVPPPDPDPTASEQIVAIRAAGDGPVNLAVRGATVTYVKPAVGSEAAGFFVQSERAGPAVYLQVDPASLSPAPSAGDVVDFTATAKATVAGQERVTALSGYARTGTGANVSALAQDLSNAADLVTSLPSYESEVIDLDATISGTFGSAGPDHVSALITTAGLPSGDPSLRLRVRESVASSLDLAQGCEVRVDNTPLWRLDGQAQPSAWSASDLTVDSCPAPKLLSAAATSPTSVTLTFDRLIDPPSVQPGGSQFTFDNGLTASAASVAGKTVTVTTSAQTPVASYTVIVASTVTDTMGTGVGSPTDTATFGGFSPPGP